MLRLGGLLLTAASLALLGWLAEAQGGAVQRLLDTAERDPAYKVRMQALRVLSRRLVKEPRPLPEAVIVGLGRVVARDEEPLVRGLGCVVLGSLEDRRAQPLLEAAARDPSPTVRAQAVAALGKLAPAASGPEVLVIDAERMPGLEVPEALLVALREHLMEGSRASAGSREVSDGRGAGRGFYLSGSIAELASEHEEDGQRRVTVGVRLTLATWPDRHLRQVLSAKASARGKNRGPLGPVQEKLLRAAAEQALRDALREIGEGDR